EAKKVEEAEAANAEDIRKAKEAKKAEEAEASAKAEKNKGVTATPPMSTPTSIQTSELDQLPDVPTYILILDANNTVDVGFILGRHGGIPSRGTYWEASP